MPRDTDVGSRSSMTFLPKVVSGLLPCLFGVVSLFYQSASDPWHVSNCLILAAQHSLVSQLSARSFDVQLGSACATLAIGQCAPSYTAMPRLYRHTLRWSLGDRRPAAGRLPCSHGKLVELVSEGELSCHLDEHCSVALQSKGSCCSIATPSCRDRRTAWSGTVTTGSDSGAECCFEAECRKHVTSKSDHGSQHGNCSEGPNQMSPRPHRIGTRSCCTHLLLEAWTVKKFSRRLSRNIFYRHCWGKPLARRLETTPPA